jgi:hypothetical protein
MEETMDSTPNLPGNQSLDSSTLAGGVKERSAQTRRTVAIALWLIGFIVLVAASVIVRSHPAPWPFDLQTTITLQHLHLPSWVITVIGWPTTVNDPIPQVSSFLLWFVVLSLIGVVVWRRGGSPIPWFVTALFLSLASLSCGYSSFSSISLSHAHVQVRRSSMCLYQSQFLLSPRVM